MQPDNQIPTSNNNDPAPPAQNMENNPPANSPATDPNANQPSMQNQSISSPKKSNKIIIGAIIAIVVLLIGGGAYFAYSLLIANKAYTKSDLTSVSASSYTFSYPKSWQDGSNNDTVKKFIAIGDTISDVKIVGTHINKDLKNNTSIAIFGDLDLGVSDSELQPALDNPTEKQQIIDSFKSSISSSDLATSSKCKVTGALNTNVNTDNPNFLLYTTVSADCTLDNNQKGHLYYVAGVKNGKIYFGTLATLKTDWDKNSTFYTKDMFPSLMPN